jgi:flavorubredoxin
MLAAIEQVKQAYEQTVEAKAEHEATIANHRKGRSTVQRRQAIEKYLTAQDIKIDTYKLPNGELTRLWEQFTSQTGFEIAKATFSTHVAKYRHNLRTIAEEQHKRDITDACDRLASGESTELRPPDHLRQVIGSVKIIKL